MLDEIWEFIKAHPVAVALSIFFLFRYFSIRFAKEVVVEGSRVVPAGSLEDLEKMLKANNLLIVDFYANWCPGCVTAAPEFARLSKIFTNVSFVKVNTDVVTEAAKKFNISVLPTLKIFTNSKEASSMAGFNKADIIEKLETFGGIAQIE